MPVKSLQDPTQKVTLQGGTIRIFFKIRDEKLEGNPVESGPSEDAEEKPVQAGRAGASQHSSCRAWGRSLWNGEVS